MLGKLAVLEDTELFFPKITEMHRKPQRINSLTTAAAHN